MGRNNNQSPKAIRFGALEHPHEVSESLILVLLSIWSSETLSTISVCVVVERAVRRRIATYERDTRSNQIFIHTVGYNFWGANSTHF